MSPKKPMPPKAVVVVGASVSAPPAGGKQSDGEKLAPSVTMNESMASRLKKQGVLVESTRVGTCSTLLEKREATVSVPCTAKPPPMPAIGGVMLTPANPFAVSPACIERSLKELTEIEDDALIETTGAKTDMLEEPLKDIANPDTDTDPDGADTATAAVAPPLSANNKKVDDLTNIPDLPVTESDEMDILPTEDTVAAPVTPTA